MLKHRTPRYVDLVSPSIWEYRLNDKTIIDVIYDQKFPEIQLFTSNSIFFSRIIFDFSDQLNIKKLHFLQIIKTKMLKKPIVTMGVEKKI